MRRETTEDRAAVRQRRLESLGRELREAGLLREEYPESGPESGTLPEPVLVPDPGRHAGLRSPSVRERFGQWVDEGVPGRLRVSLGVRHLAPLLAGLVIALVVAAWFALRSSPEVLPAPVVATEPAPVGTASPRTGPTPTASPSVVVDVTGKVRRPGIARLPAGSRVIDALRHAGGARAGADLSGLNLARVLVDGEQVVVGRAAVSSAGAPPSGSSGARVDLNTAGLEQLDALPGVGPVTAQKILDWRTEHGPFTSIEELLDVDGIGAKTLADIEPRATL